MVKAEQQKLDLLSVILLFKKYIALSDVSISINKTQEDKSNLIFEIFHNEKKTWYRETFNN